MKKLILCLILLCAAFAQADEYLGSWKIDDYITITVTTHQFSTGNAYAATGNVLLDIYEDDTNTEIVDDTTMSNFDGRTGLYQAKVQLLTATGFEKGKHYTCVVAATVDSVSALWAANFQIEAEVDSNTNSGTVTPAAASITAATIASNAFTSDELATSFIDEFYDDLLTNNKVKKSAGWWLQKGGGGEPISIHSGTAQAGTANTITLATTADATSGSYVPTLITLTGGTGAPAIRTIVAYNGTTKVATVNEDWPNTNPSSDTTYDITAAPASEMAHEGLAQAGDATHITLAADASATTDIYVGSWVILRSGTGATDTQTITAYNGSTKQATVAGWAGDAPSTDTYYVVMPKGDLASDIPLPAGLTLEEVQYAIDARLDTTETIIGSPGDTDLVTDINNIAVTLDSLSVGGISIDPNTGLGYQDVFAIGTGTHTPQVFYLATGPSTDNYYRGSLWVAIVEDADTGYKGGGYIQSYIGSSKLVVLKNQLPFTPAQNDVVWVIPLGAGLPEFNTN